MAPATPLTTHSFTRERMHAGVARWSSHGDFTENHAGTRHAEALLHALADLAKANSVACVLAEGGTEKTSEVKSVRVPVGDAS